MDIEWELKEGTSQSIVDLVNMEENQKEVDFRRLLEMKLQEYQDVEDDQFKIVEENFEQQLRKAKEYQTTYMHQHSSVIPIGTNYQAILPQIIPESHYKIRSREIMKRLRILKINDPVRLKQFTQQYQEIIKRQFEQFELSEQDYSIMYNNFKQYGNQGDVSFAKYLEKTKVYWNNYFQAKQKFITKSMNKKKKKKSKGSIPI